MYLSALRGADWLRRANGADGRFSFGHVPALKVPLEGDQFLRQAGAACALAKASRLLGEERYAAVARQAVLALLVETALDQADPQVRQTTLPSAIVNRLGAAGLLVMAINELQAPGDDLLEQSEQLCQFIRKQQLADGSFNWTVFCTANGNPCNGNSSTVDDYINDNGTSTTILLDELIGPLNAGAHTTLFSDLSAHVGNAYPVAIVNDSGGMIGWAWFHLTGSVGGSTKQISGWFDDKVNPAPMKIVQGHGNGTPVGTYAVDLIN